MSQKQKKDAIGFPPPLLGELPLRLPVLAEASDWVALDKPAGVRVRDYHWDGAGPTLDAALNRQLKADKPELLRRGATLFGSVYYLDPEISGVTVFAKSRPGLAKLRNRFGSGECAFVFTFISGPRVAGLEEDVWADAPLLPHRVKPKMIPSTAKGKKSSTRFCLLAQSATGWTLWEARAQFFRPHQIRAHAAVLGIPVLGDVLYGGLAVPGLRELRSARRGAGLSAPAFEGLALHLSRCSLDLSGSEAICSELPRQLQLFLRRIDLGQGRGIEGS